MRAGDTRSCALGLERNSLLLINNELRHLWNVLDGETALRRSNRETGRPADFFRGRSFLSAACRIFREVPRREP
jgi:hypothetical protein